MSETVQMPRELLFPVDAFAGEYVRHRDAGEELLGRSSIAVVGLARNCAPELTVNLERLLALGASAADYRVHVFTNDNEDDTEQVLVDASRHMPLTFTSHRLGRKQRGGEFAGPRTLELAEYRAACQRWVRGLQAIPDLVVVLDFDMWGGWSHDGVLHAVGWMLVHDDAYGMASVSMMQFPTTITHSDGRHETALTWLHYDAWALRLNSYWDDYRAGCGGWKQMWLPPVGSPPIPVCSAFGGMALYRGWAYLGGEYGGQDCEHVVFHRTIQERHQKRLYLDPSMRTVMHWITDGGRDCDH